MLVPYNKNPGKGNEKVIRKWYNLAKEEKKKVTKLKEIFNPKSVAIVGASNNSSKWSYGIMSNIINAGYEGTLYPINPKDEQVLGLKAYKSILDIEDPVDMITVCVGAELVPGIIRQAVQKKVKLAIIITNGFREVGRKDLEDEILDAIKDSDLRILGPNVQGTISTGNKLSNIFNMDFPKAGRIGIVAQSGSASAYVTERMNVERIGISTMINLGNQVDLSECDFIKYFAEEDDETDLIAAYIEGPKDKANFKNVLIESAYKKPIILMKPGVTEVGQKAAASHTGSIAGNDKIFSYACKQYGIVRCETVTEYVDTIGTFASCKIPQGDRSLIMTTSGGMGSISADELVKQGLKVAEIPKDVVEGIKEITGIKKGIANIMDLEINEGNFKLVYEAMEANYKDYFDSYFVVLADGMKGMEKFLKDMIENTDKPVIIVYISDSIPKAEAVDALRDEGKYIFDCPDRAAKALANMVWYYEKRRKANV